jgi:hypothetical protein
MAFVNEHIPFGSDEAKRLDLPELMKRFRNHEDYMYRVTIDRERNLFFVQVKGMGGGADPQDEDYNLLYVLNIDGYEVTINLRSVGGDYEGEPGNYRATMSRWRLNWIGNYPNQALEDDDPRRVQAISLLKEALQAYGSMGQLVVSPNFIAETEF